MGRGRPAKVAIVRQVIYFILRECCAATWEEAGAAFDRDHGTAIHGHRVVSTMLKVEADDSHRPTAALIRNLCAATELPVPKAADETPGL
jgi:chromosomal replication initiation ATPase DnaA